MKALGFSLACRARYCSPPASESAFRIIARKSALSLLGVPATRPPVLRPLAILLPSSRGAIGSSLFGMGSNDLSLEA